MLNEYHRLDENELCVSSEDSASYRGCSAEISRISGLGRNRLQNSLIFRDLDLIKEDLTKYGSRKV